MNAASLIRYTVNENGCWLWGGFVNPRGYGHVQHNGTTRLAHRSFYETYVGPIPAGLTIDHVCHNDSDCAGGPTCLHRRCVNPQHLEAVPHRENILRGLCQAAANAKKTHCKRGHEFTPDNLYHFTNASGRQSRKCRTCTRERRQRQALAAANVPVLSSSSSMKVEP